jgi:hypothetical protein
MFVGYYCFAVGPHVSSRISWMFLYGKNIPKGKEQILKDELRSKLRSYMTSKQVKKDKHNKGIGL